MLPLSAEHKDEAEKMKQERLERERLEHLQDASDAVSSMDLGDAADAVSPAASAAASPYGAAAAPAPSTGSRKRSRSVAEGEPGWSSTGEPPPPDVLRQLQAGGGAQETMAEKQLVGKGMRRISLCSVRPPPARQVSLCVAPHDP